MDARIDSVTIRLYARSILCERIPILSSFGDRYRRWSELLFRPLADHRSDIPASQCRYPQARRHSICCSESRIQYTA